jgi:hypothetical protein
MSCIRMCSWGWCYSFQARGRGFLAKVLGSSDDAHGSTFESSDHKPVTAAALQEATRSYFSVTSAAQRGPAEDLLAVRAAVLCCALILHPQGSSGRGRGGSNWVQSQLSSACILHARMLRTGCLLPSFAHGPVNQARSACFLSTHELVNLNQA